MQTRSRAAQAWDALLVVLLVGSVGIVFWYESTANEAIRRWIERIDLALVAFFVSEWAWRVRKAPKPGRAAVRWSWELLGMVPLVAPLPGFLRILRLVRLVRILRVFGKLGKALGTWERIAAEGNLHKIGLASGSVTVAGSLLVWAVERQTNPALAQYSEALWWAMVTVTTVGYGDITPITTTGRFIAGGLMVTGIGTIGLLASTLASALVKPSGTSERPASSEIAMAGSMARDLEMLAELHGRGKLTDAEYESAKGRVLGLDKA